MGQLRTWASNIADASLSRSVQVDRAWKGVRICCTPALPEPNPPVPTHHLPIPPPPHQPLLLCWTYLVQLASQWLVAHMGSSPFKWLNLQWPSCGSFFDVFITFCMLFPHCEHTHITLNTTNNTEPPLMLSQIIVPSGWVVLLSSVPDIFTKLSYSYWELCLGYPPYKADLFIIHEVQALPHPSTGQNHSFSKVATSLDITGADHTWSSLMKESFRLCFINFSSIIVKVCSPHMLIQYLNSLPWFALG